MKALGLILFALIILLQHPLWLGKGSWHRVWEVDQQVVAQHETNQKLQIRNAALGTKLPPEVRDKPHVRVFKSSKKAIIDIALIHTKAHLLDNDQRQQLQRYAAALELQLT